MNILRLSTLSLAVALAVLALAYANPSFAGKKCDEDDTHPSCKDAGGDAEYTATLTMGAFKFDPVDVTPNKRGTSYHSNFSLDMDRPPADGSPDQLEWDLVFRACTPPLLSDPIPGVFVGRDNWSINNAGGKVSGNADSDFRIRFHDIVDGTNDIDFDLIGKLGTDPFLPAPGKTSVFNLTMAVIFGQDKNLGCKSGNFDLFLDSKLKIFHKK